MDGFSDTDVRSDDFDDFMLLFLYDIPLDFVKSSSGEPLTANNQS